MQGDFGGRSLSNHYFFDPRLKVFLGVRMNVAQR